jgi:hypothetical protein
MRTYTIALAVCVAGCSPEVESRTWTPIDFDEIAFALDNPTARLADDPQFDMLGASLLMPSTASNVDSALGDVRGVLSDDSTGEAIEDMNTGTELGSGTSFYLEIACGGPDRDNPDRTFDFGLIRMDSPALTREVVENLEIEGDLLLTFESCSSEGFTYDGTAPSAYQKAETEQLASRLALDVYDEVEQTTDRLDTDAMFEPMRTRFVQPSDGGGNYTLELDEAAGTTALYAADGVLRCVNSTGACTGP